MDCRALALAITPPGLPRLGRPARAVASRCEPLSRQGATAVSFAPAVAATLLPLPLAFPASAIW